MVVKKKELYLGLLLFFLGTSNVMQAYKLTIKNNTEHKIIFTVKYHGEFLISCMPDTKKLASGNSVKLSSGACTVKEVVALIYLPKKKYPPRWEAAKPYEAPLGRAGNSTFVVSKYGKKFKITRE